MFTKRNTVEEKFTQFLGDRYHWQTDRQLQREMQKLINQYPDRDEKSWFRYFLQCVRDKNCSLAKRHLQAYLEELYAYCAYSAVTKFGKMSDSFDDCLQKVRLMGGDVLRFWQNYQFELGNPIAYARQKLDRSLIESIFTAHQDKPTSGYGWLVRVSAKFMREALADFSEVQRSQYLTVWWYLKEMRSYLPKVKSVIQEPTPEQLAKIAQLYQSSTGISLSPEQIKKILSICIAALQRKRPQREISLDALQGKEDDIEQQTAEDILDTLLADVDIFPSSEEFLENSRIISVVLGDSVTSLHRLVERLPKKIASDTAEQLLILRYGLVGVKQVVIGKSLGFKQFEVSRQLSRIKKYLITELTTLAKQHKQISFDGDFFETLAEEIDDLLAWYCREQVIYKELADAARSHPKLWAKINILSVYFGQLPHEYARKLTCVDLTPSELDKLIKKVKEKLNSSKSEAENQLQITEQELLQSIDDLISEFVLYLSEYLRKKFSFTVEIISTIKECLERAVYVFLCNAPYGLIQISEC
jgi:hypothetical protein